MSPGSLGTEAEILGSLCQHRALSTPQVRAIHLPERSARTAQQAMAGLARRGLVAFATVPGVPGAPRRLWYVTEAGAEAARDAGVLDGPPRLLSAEQVTGPLRAHTVAVNDVGISFLEAARQRGDEFGPSSWRHEVGHPLNARRGRERRALYADALITYVRLTAEELVVEQRFLELDRATLSIDRLVAELSGYARLYKASGADGEPYWRERYPWFPPVLCVLTGASRAALERRRNAAVAMLARDLELGRTPEVSVRICLASDLRDAGPFAPIFTDVREPGAPTDWLVGEAG
ncbi:MAG TPA: replication-relaxation family protein [Solirubrobacterales bacterium]|nr:replication-relaxation family protein [Solirubrobacterales bacterium]